MKRMLAINSMLKRMLEILLGLSLVSTVHAEHVTHSVVENHTQIFTIHKDLTYERIINLDVSLVTRRGVSEWSSIDQSYYPDSESYELLEAWVDQPDGKRISVPEDSVFTRPSAESEDAPGFDSSLTTTVLFPQLHEGSHIHIKWKVTQTKPSVVGFNFVSSDLNSDCPNYVIQLSAPEELNLRWGVRGDVDVKTHVENHIKHWEVHMPPSPVSYTHLTLPTSP
jgi:hypothetical protein